MINVMSKDKTIKTGVLMSPASDISNWLVAEVFDNLFNVFVEMANGKLAYGDREEYKADMIKAAKGFNPMDKVTDIEAPILVTVGSADNLAHPDECKALYEKATPPKKWALIDGADHRFSDHRLILQEKVLEWLNENL